MKITIELTMQQADSIRWAITNGRDNLFERQCLSKTKIKNYQTQIARFNKVDEMFKYKIRRGTNEKN